MFWKNRELSNQPKPERKPMHPTTTNDRLPTPLDLWMCGELVKICCGYSSPNKVVVETYFAKDETGKETHADSHEATP